MFVIRFIIFAAFHSLFSAQQLKNLICGIFPKGLQYYRVTYNLVSLGMFGWVMASYRNSPVLYYAPGVWSLVMYLLQLIIAVALLACLRQTGIADFTGIRQIRSNETAEPCLVATGFYAVVRHPLYLLSTLFLVLNPVMTAQWLLLTVLSTIYFICGALIEERRLFKQFGDEYRRYQQNTPFIIPSLVKFRQPPSV